LGGFILLAIVLTALTVWNFYRTPIETEEQRMIKDNAQLLRQALIENVTEYKIIALSDLTPFEWDRVLFFGGYTHPETMYEAAGYKWDRISEVGEFETDLIFMYKNKVVCYLTEHISSDYIDNRSHTIYTTIRSEKNELHKEDNPKFLVTDMSRSESRYGTRSRLYLSWFDDALVDIDENNSHSESLAGQWSGRLLDFVVTKEGLVRGYISYSRSEPDGHRIEAPVFARFMGVLHDDTAQCTFYSIRSGGDYANNYDGQTPIAFDLTYSEEEHQFNLVIDFSDKMQIRHIDGDLLNIDRKITAESVPQVVIISE